MKIGIRTPSPKRSIKARTTGRVKRKIKGSINPFYGKKGMGYLKDPERAIKNKIYHKVTIDPLEGLKKGHKKKTHESKVEASPRPKKGIMFPMILFYIFGILLTSASIDIYLLNNTINLFTIIAAAACFVFYIICYERKYG